jgi:hypothetical protein
MKSKQNNRNRKLSPYFYSRLVVLSIVFILYTSKTYSFLLLLSIHRSDIVHVRILIFNMGRQYVLVTTCVLDRHERAHMNEKYIKMLDNKSLDCHHHTTE